jgi:hypothetical protein
LTNMLEPSYHSLAISPLRNGGKGRASFRSVEGFETWFPVERPPIIRCSGRRPGAISWPKQAGGAAQFARDGPEWFGLLNRWLVVPS